MVDVTETRSYSRPTKTSFSLVGDVLLILILLIGAVFRFIGVEWDQGTHMHPDERFLTMVESAIQPVDSLAQYFNTAESSLNPHNQGYKFYVYGTLPLFLVRYVGEWVNQTGYGQIDILGRQFSALFDLGTVFLVFLIAQRLYGRKSLALLAALFYALAVLPIQLSHFFKEDTFMTFFATLTVYFGVRVLRGVGEEDLFSEGGIRFWSWGRGFIAYALFGAALGMAVASKINAAPLALLLPGAVLVRYLTLPKDARGKMLGVYILNLVLAGFVALLVFRICQPYAFQGPGFFGMRLNDKWIANMRDLANQSSGDVDFPPQLQWARRPIWFGLQNLVVWGLGFPLGALACAGFLWMGWKIFRGEWQKHALLWAWVGLYFAWQSSNATPSMRYFMPIYPLLAIVAAWAISHLWDAASKFHWRKILAVVVGAVVTAGTLAYAVAFLDAVYLHPFTRAEASHWIYQNVPGPINLYIENGQEKDAQLLAFKSGYRVDPVQPTKIAFTARESGTLLQVKFPFVKDNQTNPQIASLVVMIADANDPAIPLGYGTVSDVFRTDSDSRGKSYITTLNQPVKLEAGKTYDLILIQGTQNSLLEITDAPLLSILVGEDVVQQALPEAVDVLRETETQPIIFSAKYSGTLRKVYIRHLLDWEANPTDKTIELSITDVKTNKIVATASVTNSFLPVSDYRGEDYWFELDQPVDLVKDGNYILTLDFRKGPGALAVYGSKHAIESSWDDALPLGVDGYNPYDIRNGVFRSDLNFEMYWDDNPEKLARFENNLDQADYLFISSNRQWGTTTRVPERYPLTTQYYRSLLGCPADKDVVWCYAVAEPGMFKGQLGFDLVKVFQANPTLDGLSLNSQFAEEAFTVYDSPKVLIFQKNASYTSLQARELLKTVDLSMAVHLTPAQAGKYPGNLQLQPEQLARQQAGGTWADLFDREALQNRYPGLAVVLWYLVVSLLGWICYPLVRLALRGLPDHGYPFVRLVGMLLLAYPVWLIASVGGTFSIKTISVVAAGLLVVNLVLGWIQREELARDLRQNWRYFLRVEIIGLIFFGIFLLVRLGNPDLWHPSKGGEKPMDFSYFNAVLKSTTFPPYDPWFAGGYINYYYYGFVLVGVLVKWLGIIPAVAYNIVLPQLYSLLALGAFSILWNLLVSSRREREGKLSETSPYLAALVGSCFLGVLGNLGSLRMIWHGLMKLAAPSGNFAIGDIIQKITWTVTGLLKYIAGARLPYAPGDWYWIPSRAIPLEPITEFPAFTFLYADLHAHMIALPVTLLALAWGLSIYLGRWEWGVGKGWTKWLHFAASFLLGGLVIGTLRTTNTWDFPTYLAICVVALVYTVWVAAPTEWLKLNIPEWMKRLIIAGGCATLLTAIAQLSFLPFSRWYGQAYGSVDIWKGAHTPLWSYITHWGLFLFMIISWLVWESRDWMATTPVSSLNKLRPYQEIIYSLLIGLVMVVVALLALKVEIGWLILPLAVWAGVLLLRPKMPAARRAVLFLIGTGLVLTLMVELIVLRGDLGRMNTVFKFYLQAWTLLSLSAAAALAWVFPAVEREWLSGWRNSWTVAAAFLIGSAALFPMLASADKITDRISARTPHTLDGMAYMAYSTYNEGGVNMDLSGDYRAIQWVQDHIAGSPVIVEGNVTEYRWANRFTINTGLPSVVGWNWHQRQQRALTPSAWVTDRVQAVNNFYATYNRTVTETFLRKFDVSYIIVGVMEHTIYPADGLAKFEAWNGDLWDVVYRDGNTVIYQVRK
jgi:YYY domain-containing protein